MSADGPDFARVLHVILSAHGEVLHAFPDLDTSSGVAWVGHGNLRQKLRSEDYVVVDPEMAWINERNEKLLAALRRIEVLDHAAKCARDLLRDYDTHRPTDPLVPGNINSSVAERLRASLEKIQ